MNGYIRPNGPVNRGYCYYQLYTDFVIIIHKIANISKRYVNNIMSRALDILT